MSTTQAKAIETIFFLWKPLNTEQSIPVFIIPIGTLVQKKRKSISNKDHCKNFNTSYIPEQLLKACSPALSQFKQNDF